MASPLPHHESQGTYTSAIEGQKHGLRIYTGPEEFQTSSEYHPVETVQIQNVERDNGLSVHYFDVTMDGGMKHPGVFVQPERGIRRELPESSILRLGNTAWTTSVLGYNLDVQTEEASKYGIPSVAIGTHKNVLKFGTIGQYGHTSLEVGKHFAKEYGYNEQIMTASGDSRGAEITTAMASFAQLHDLAVAYADAKALCGAEEVEMKPLPLMKFLWDLRNEVTNGVREIAQHPTDKLWRMKSTIDLNPVSVLQHAKDANTLRTDEAYQILKGYAEGDMFIYFSFDRLDSLAKTALWEAGITADIFKRAFLDVYEGKDGSHLGSCASPRALNARMGRFANIYTLINDFGDSFNSLGRDSRIALHEAAVQLNGSDFQKAAREDTSHLKIVSTK